MNTFFGIFCPLICILKIETSTFIGEIIPFFMFKYDIQIKEFNDIKEKRMKEMEEQRSKQLEKLQLALAEQAVFDRER